MVLFLGMGQHYLYKCRMLVDAICFVLSSYFVERA